MEGSSLARKRKSKPTKAGGPRATRQEVRPKYARAREDAQLAGLIPTTPEGAIRDERVDPASQDGQRFPGLDRLAILNDGSGGWAVPEHVKRKVIEQNAEVLFERRTVTRFVEDPVTGEKTEVTVELPPDRGAQQQSSKILLLADQRQHERDNPEAAGKARGGLGAGGIVIDNQVNVAVVEKLDQLVEQARRRAGALRGGPNAGQQPPAEGPGGGGAGPGAK